MEEFKLKVKIEETKKEIKSFEKQISSLQSFIQNITCSVKRKQIELSELEDTARGYDLERSVSASPTLNE
jgi:predicted  nucleic acid-binding Zn-ribbon protein